MNELSSEILYEIISCVYENEYDVNFQKLRLVSKQFKDHVDLFFTKQRVEFKRKIQDTIKRNIDIKKRFPKTIFCGDEVEVSIGDNYRYAKMVIVTDKQCPDELETRVGYYVLVANKIGDREIRFNNMF
jgi:hypothetical protein